MYEDVEIICTGNPLSNGRGPSDQHRNTYHHNCILSPYFVCSYLFLKANVDTDNFVQYAATNANHKHYLI